MFETLQRLYSDLARSTHPPPHGAIRRIQPVGHILVGSDWPFTPEMGVARNIQLLTGNPEVSDSDACAIARENAERTSPRLAEARSSSIRLD